MSQQQKNIEVFLKGESEGEILYETAQRGFTKSVPLGSLLTEITGETL